MADKDLPFTTLQSVMLCTGSLAVIWTSLSSYVNKRGAFSWAETILETHDFILASLSLVLAAYIADIGHNVLHARTGYEINPSLVGYLYHLLKIYEYFDIILLVLSGKTTITKYTAFSHLFMPYWSYYRIIDRPHDSFDWRFQAIADCLARFSSRAIPWLIADLKTEETLLNLSQESRWYPDLAITGFWALFTLQGQRESEQAIRSFGKPYEEEFTARLLSAGILLYASYARRQEIAGKSAEEKRKEDAKTNNTSPQSAARSSQRSVRHGSRRNR